MKKALLSDVIAAILILLFLYASFSKLFDLWGFKYDLSKQPFPHWLQRLLVWVVPFSEIFISVLLIFARSRKTGFYLALFLMLLFTGYTAAILLHFFPFVPCGCGGVIKTLTWPEHLIFNLFFVFIIISGICLHQDNLNEAQSKMVKKHF
jgi:putative oxidoreductase